MQFIKEKRKWLILVLAIVIIWMLVAPPRFVLNLTKRVDLSDPVSAGAQVVEKYECRQCHTIEGQGALLGPKLDTILSRYDDITLRLWLKNPRAIKRNTAMPNFKLSDSEIEAIVQYLISIQK